MEEDERLLMKRKDIDRLNEELSDFYLSSPAKKIRRLNVREEEIDIAMQDTAAEELESAPVNEERSIILFKPLYYHPPPSENLFVDKNLISSFKNRFLRDASMANGNQNEDQTSNKCQAVVCWNPSQFPHKPHTPEIIDMDETGEDAVMEVVDNEVEEASRSTGLLFPQQGQQQQPPQEVSAYGFGLHQWQQQQNSMIM